MFYLKYRPQTISEIDNENIKEKLVSVLKTENIPHAFLFTGQKGTGKTSTARIIAKAINCENNFFAKKTDSIEPCNICNNCKSITSGNSIDIIELDAASNRKIDEIRDLLSKIKFNPVTNRFKVYIIDEVHMLTTESFNALLKTLEEPPKSTIFILATTEIEKLPKTIVSRCIRFNFGKANQKDIAHMLNRICEKEKITLSQEIITFIAKHSDNSFRDATKILEELTFNKNEISIKDVKNNLGINDNDNNLLKIIESKDLKECLLFIENYEKNAGSFKALIESHLDTLHQILLKKNNLENTLEDNYNFSLKEISLLIKLFQEAYNNLKYSPIEALPLELSIVEYFEKIKN